MKLLVIVLTKFVVQLLLELRYRFHFLPTFLQTQLMFSQINLLYFNQPQLFNLVHFIIILLFLQLIHQKQLCSVLTVLNFLQLALLLHLQQHQ